VKKKNKSTKISTFQPVNIPSPIPQLNFPAETNYDLKVMPRQREPLKEGNKSSESTDNVLKPRKKMSSLAVLRSPTPHHERVPSDPEILQPRITGKNLASIMSSSPQKNPSPSATSSQSFLPVATASRRWETDDISPDASMHKNVDVYKHDEFNDSSFDNPFQTPPQHPFHNDTDPTPVRIEFGESSLMKDFDVNGDGKLDAEEKRALNDYLNDAIGADAWTMSQTPIEEETPEPMSRADFQSPTPIEPATNQKTNRGGFQSPAPAEPGESSLLIQFDVNGDGKLDAGERAALTSYMDESGIDRNDWTIGSFGDDAMAEKQTAFMNPENVHSQSSTPITGHARNQNTNQAEFQSPTPIEPGGSSLLKEFDMSRDVWTVGNDFTPEKQIQINDPARRYEDEEPKQTRKMFEHVAQSKDVNKPKTDFFSYDALISTPQVEKQYPVKTIQGTSTYEYERDYSLDSLEDLILDDIPPPPGERKNSEPKAASKVPLDVPSDDEEDFGVSAGKEDFFNTIICPDNLADEEKIAEIDRIARPANPIGTPLAVPFRSVDTKTPMGALSNADSSKDSNARIVRFSMDSDGEHTSVRRSVESKRSEMEEDLSKLTKEIEEQIKERDELKEISVQQQEEYQKKINEHQELRDAIFEADIAAAKMEDKLRIYDNETKRMEVEIAAAHMKKQAQMEALERIKADVQTLEQETDNMIHQHGEEREDLNRIKTEFKTELEKLTLEKAENEEELKRRKEELTTFQDEIERIQKQISKEAENLDVMKSKMSKKQFDNQDVEGTLRSCDVSDGIAGSELRKGSMEFENEEREFTQQIQNAGKELEKKRDLLKLQQQNLKTLQRYINDNEETLANLETRLIQDDSSTDKRATEGRGNKQYKCIPVIFVTILCTIAFIIILIILLQPHLKSCKNRTLA